MIQFKSVINVLYIKVAWFWWFVKLPCWVLQDYINKLVYRSDILQQGNCIMLVCFVYSAKTFLNCCGSIPSTNCVQIFITHTYFTYKGRKRPLSGAHIEMWHYGFSLLQILLALQLPRKCHFALLCINNKFQPTMNPVWNFDTDKSAPRCFINSKQNFQTQRKILLSK